MNLQILSDFSSPTIITAAAVAVQLGSATTTLSGTDVIVTWPATTNDRGSTVTAYRIKFKTSVGTYVAQNTYCDGTQTTIINSRQCTVPMSVFTSAPYFIAVGDPIVAEVEAYNAQGYSTPSSDNTGGATAMTAPQSAPTPVNGASTSSTQVEITWSGISTSPANGGSTVTDYKIYYAIGASTTYTPLASSTSGATSYIHTGVTPGQTFSYKVLATNAFGDGPLTSSPVTIIATTVPSAPAAPTTTDTGSDILVTWSYPSSDGGSSVTSYTIYLQESDSTWATEPTSCNGSDSTILGNMYCNIPYTTLQTSFGLSTGDTVYAKVVATNIVGSSAESPLSTLGGSAIMP